MEQTSSWLRVSVTFKSRSLRGSKSTVLHQMVFGNLKKSTSTVRAKSMRLGLLEAGSSFRPLLTFSDRNTTTSALRIRRHQAGITFWATSQTSTTCKVASLAWTTLTSLQAWMWSITFALGKPARAQQAARSVNSSQFFQVSESWQWLLSINKEIKPRASRQRPQLLRVMAPPTWRIALTDLTAGRLHWPCHPDLIHRRGSAPSEAMANPDLFQNIWIIYINLTTDPEVAQQRLTSSKINSH